MGFSASLFTPCDPSHLSPFSSLPTTPTRSSTATIAATRAFAPQIPRFHSSRREWSPAISASRRPPAPTVGTCDGGASLYEGTAISEPGHRPELDSSSGSGGNGKLPAGGGGGGRGSGGGGGGDSGEGDDDMGEEEFGPVLNFEQVMREAEARGASLPADMLEAARTIGIPELLLSRYLDLQACFSIPV